MIDNYPLPASPPLELFEESFSVVVDFNFDPKTFIEFSAEFSVTTLSTSSNSSNPGLVKRDDAPTVDAIDSDITSSITVTSKLAPILEGLLEPRIVFLAYATVALFTEREEFVVNRTLVQGSVVVMEARVSGGGAVSDIEDVVTLVFPKNEIVSIV